MSRGLGSWAKNGRPSGDGAGQITINNRILQIRPCDACLAALRVYLLPFGCFICPRVVLHVVAVLKAEVFMFWTS